MHIHRWWIFWTTFFTKQFPTTTPEICSLCLESCLVSLENFALLHCRFLILKLILKFWYCCTEKYFLLFTLHEIFSNRCNVPFIYEFNLLSPYLVLCDKKHFFQSWLIWTTFHTARENFWPIKSSLC